MINTARALREINAYIRDCELSAEEIGELNNIVGVLKDNPDIEGKDLATGIWNYIETRNDFLSEDAISLLEDIASNVSDFGIWSM